MTATRIIQVALPTPLRRLFDYRLPEGVDESPAPGCRVRVPFGPRKLVGWVVGAGPSGKVDEARIREALELIDPAPVIPESSLDLIRWTARYYHHPLGEVFAAAVPAMIRDGGSTERTRTRVTVPEDARDDAPATRAHRQRQVWEQLRALDWDAGIAALDTTPDVLRRMADKGLIRMEEVPVRAGPWPEPAPSALELNPAQTDAVAAIEQAIGDGFRCALLDGVTGSGKTEVYLRAIRSAIGRGEQTLVLVPEISLTPQLLARFEADLGVAPVMLHSGMSDGDRGAAWLDARDGHAAVIVGTRSAVFTPMARPGLIIVDEEHDTSFKQQDGLRYNARDLAVVRARDLGIPVVLGSATPALESLENARQGRYLHLRLPQRTGTAPAARVRMVDLQREAEEHGLTNTLKIAMREHLDAGNQVLLFLNRRGFAPALFCPDCRWAASCDRCDARLTLHLRQHRLTCHHCDRSTSIPERCPDCVSELVPVGRGTQRVEDGLAAAFPDRTITRIDRDSTRKRGELESLLERAHAGEAQILLGTQMLAKGHHLPDVTLVAVLDADQGLFGTDFRSGERLAQLLVQVAGRAGRADKRGEVLIQTTCPEHPLFSTLLDGGYAAFAERALDERRESGWPPYQHLALVRAESPHADAAMGFLAELRDAMGASEAQVLGPAPAVMERRAGMHRAQLLVVGERAALHRTLQRMVDRLEGGRSSRRVRWSLDVDPVELF